MKELRSILRRRARFGAILTTLPALLLLGSLNPAWAKKGGNGGGKPGGGDPPPPSSTATVEYELTWLDGFGGDSTEISTVNSAGIVIGRSQDSTGTFRPFWATAAGGMIALDGWWQYPVGYENWRMARSYYQINESNQVCGWIVNEQSTLTELFIADFDDPTSLEPLGIQHDNDRLILVYMNSHGDISYTTPSGTSIYVRSLDQVFVFDLAGEVSGINDNLQLSMKEWISPYGYTNAARFTFDLATETGLWEDLGANLGRDAVCKAQDISNDGTVYGHYEDGDVQAGFVEGGATTWSELDSNLPSGRIRKNRPLRVRAGCWNANESGQVLGGYDMLGFAGSALWLSDLNDGLFDLDQLVVGDATDVDNFRAASRFIRHLISEIEPATEYGIIAGSEGPSGFIRSFILTPRLVQP